RLARNQRIYAPSARSQGYENSPQRTALAAEAEAGAGWVRLRRYRPVLRTAGSVAVAAVMTPTTAAGSSDIDRCPQPGSRISRVSEGNSSRRREPLRMTRSREP